MPFKQTATKAHAIVNETQLNSSVFSSFLRRFTGDFFEKNFSLKFMKNILQYTIDYIQM